jgi:predicted transcriptional regulator
MMAATIELNIPSEIYDRAQQIARASNRSVEAVILDALGLLFSASIAEIEPDMLHIYSDEQLWAIVHQRLT